VAEQRQAVQHLKELVAVAKAGGGTPCRYDQTKLVKKIRHVFLQRKARKKTKFFYDLRLLRMGLRAKFAADFILMERLLIPTVFPVMQGNINLAPAISFPQAIPSVKAATYKKISYFFVV